MSIIGQIHIIRTLKHSIAYIKQPYHTNVQYAVVIKIIQLFMNCGIIIVVMGIILSMMSYFLKLLKSPIGKKLSMIL